MIGIMSVIINFFLQLAELTSKLQKYYQKEITEEVQENDPNNQNVVRKFYFSMM